jgi:hypothetical protein
MYQNKIVKITLLCHVFTNMFMFRLVNINYCFSNSQSNVSNYNYVKDVHSSTKVQPLKLGQMKPLPVCEQYITP